MPMVCPRMHVRVAGTSPRLSKAWARVSVGLNLKNSSLFLFKSTGRCVFFNCFIVLESTVLRLTVILRALTCLEKGPEKEGLVVC